MAEGAGGGGAGGATGSTRGGGGGNEVIGSKGGGTGRRRGEGVKDDAMEGGIGVGTCCCFRGGAGSLIRLMTFSESCGGEWNNENDLMEMFGITHILAHLFTVHK